MGLAPGVWRVDELLAEVKGKLPDNLRYERTTIASRQDQQALIHADSPTLSVRQLAGLILGVLSVAWQLTA
ncbi:MAG: hypothetical protein ACRDQX_06360, partial [Pseudonocardiaceae bacterium]